MIPVLIITYNRLEYSKKCIDALLKCDARESIYLVIIDNGSTDGTVEWLRSMFFGRQGDYYIKLNPLNIGIHGAFNQFLELTKHYYCVAKIDNDSVIPSDFFLKMLPHLEKVDLVQAKHKLIAASGVGTFDEWVSKMPQDGELRLNHFIGGSGILCKRSVLSPLPATKNLLMPWREWQRQHPEVSKGFACDVEIELLDDHGYSDFPEYYAKTGRI